MSRTCEDSPPSVSICAVKRLAIRRFDPRPLKAKSEGLVTASQVIARDRFCPVKVDISCPDFEAIPTSSLVG